MLSPFLEELGLHILNHFDHNLHSTKKIYWITENIQILPKSLKKLILWIVQDPLVWRVGGRASKERWRTDLGLILKKKKFHHQSPSHCHLVWFPNPLAPDVCHHTATTPDIVCVTATTTTTTNGNAHLCMCVDNEQLNMPSCVCLEMQWHLFAHMVFYAS